MLETLNALSDSLSQPPLGTCSKSNFHYLSIFLSDLTPLCTTHPILFAPHLQNLLSFLPSIVLPSVDCGPTPTVGKPFPAVAHQDAFTLPPPTIVMQGQNDGNDERSTLRLSALEFMVSLTEARPNMVRKLTGWTEIIVRACLEGMGEFEEEDNLDDWLREDVGLSAFFAGLKLMSVFIKPSSNSSTLNTDSAPALYEQAIDRLACSMGGRAVLPPAFQVCMDRNVFVTMFTHLWQ